MGRLRDAFKSSSVPDEPPPSYDESRTKHQPSPSPSPQPQTQPPSQARPPPPVVGPSQQPSFIPRQFPPSFNLYLTDWTALTYSIGQHQSSPLYIYAQHSGLTSLPPVLLHSGPSTSYPPLASAEWEALTSSFDVDLPPHPGAQEPVAREHVESLFSRSGMGLGTYRFGIETGPAGDGPREEFEWRHSGGDAVASLDAHYYGWKLVRLAHGPPAGIANGDMNFVGGGFTDSEGCEVVAAWAEARGSMTKAAKFQFMGTGLTGLLGERWAIMAVITALALFQRTQRRRRQ